MKNEIRIDYTTLFNKQRKTAPLFIKEAFLESVALFLEDQNYVALRNHPLKGKFAGYRSINVTEDWRAVFKEVVSAKKIIIIFHMLGTHKQLYKK